MATTNTNEILEAIAEALAPKKAKKAKTAKYVIVVNNRVMDQRPTSKKELKQAVIAVSLANPTAKITVFKDPVEVSVDLPIAGLDGEV